MKTLLVAIVIFASSSVFVLGSSFAELSLQEKEGVQKYCPQTNSRGNPVSVIWLIKDSKSYVLKFNQRFNCKKGESVFVAGQMVHCGSVFWNFLGEMGGGDSVLCVY